MYRIRHLVKAAGSRSTVVKVLNAEQEGPVMCAIKPDRIILFRPRQEHQGSHVHAAPWQYQQQQQHPCPGLGPSVMPQGPAWFGAQWMPRGPNLSSGVPNLAAVPPFPGAGGCGCQFSCSGPRAPVGGGLCGPGMNVGGCVPQQSRVQDFASLQQS